MIAQLDSQYLKTRPGRALSRLASYALFEGRPLLTRGRWINPLVSRFAGTLGAMAGPGEVDRPIFVLGTGRSGTTILGKVLSLHRDVGFLNEPKLLWHLACPSEDINGNYSTAPAHYRLAAADATPAVVEKIRGIYRGYLRTTRNQRVVDKYPELIFRTDFVTRAFPDAKFILLVRNGDATVGSISTWSEQHASVSSGNVDDWWGRDDRKWRMLVEQLVPGDEELAPHAAVIAAFDRQADRAAVEWIVTMREVLRLRDLGDQFYELRYEQFARDPVEQLQRLFEFCGLAEDQVVLNYADSVLEYREREQQIELHPAIQPAYAQTMQALGYT